MDTKFNAERRYIGGHDVLDPMDQATHQPQLRLEFSGNTVTIDLSKSNYFILDAEECPDSNIIIQIINYDSITRFELLMLEGIEAKIINWSSITPKVSFPHPYYEEDVEEPEPLFAPEPMSDHQRRQQLITFKTVVSSNNNVEFIGVATNWFESLATHSIWEFDFREKMNYVVSTQEIRKLPLDLEIYEEENITIYRGPDNCKVEIVLEDNEDYILYSVVTSWGIAPVSIYRIPEGMDYNFKYKCYDSHNNLIKEEVITANQTRESLGQEYIPIDLENIPKWEDPDDGGLSYGIGFKVVHNSYYYISNGKIEYSFLHAGETITIPSNTLTDREPDEWDPNHTDPEFGTPDPKLGRLDWIKYFLGTEYGELGEGNNGPGWYIWVKDPVTHGPNPPPYGWEYLYDNQPDPPPGI